MVSSFGLPMERHRAASALAAELLARTAEVGPNVSQWPGLTTYRFTLPQNSQWSESQSLALYCVLQGRKRVIANGDEYQFNALSYSLIARGLRFESDIVEASVENPYLSFVLQIDPAIVRAVSSRISDQHMAKIKGECKQPSSQAVHVSQVDDNTLSAFLHFPITLRGNGPSCACSYSPARDHLPVDSSRAGGMHAPCSIGRT
ncbi:AraC family transcriptional regulator [Streptomyces sp. NBC_00259]|uniref:AraC family transcriptional regulator n=1 Tax=Streptomyces sp. NBC_00259 TaxID=2903643 RepID=UPI003FA773AE